MADCPPTPTSKDCQIAVCPSFKDVVSSETTPLTQPPKTSSSSQRALTNWQCLAYGVGHVFNDLAAAMWFSYLLIYLTEVENFEKLPAGNLILIGQVADAICTPFVGLESDRTRRGFWNLGKRKTWHFIGTVCTFLTFPFIFEPCINCSHASSALQMLYFAPFIVIFQFGWASVQISHLSFSSEISPYEHERVILQSIRNFFTVFANIAVFGMFTLLFVIGSGTSDSSSASDSGLDSSDIPKFRYMTIFCGGVGIIFNLIFYIGTANVSSKSGNENDEEKEREENTMERRESRSIASIEQSLVRKFNMSWKDWLKEHQFYQIGLLYMFTRLYFNISQVYFGIYLTKTLKLEKVYVAVMPLFIYGSSFLASILAPTINKAVGRKYTYFFGALSGIAGNIWLYLMAEGSKQVYGAAMFLGIGDSVLLITSLSMTSDLIGDNIESGAFVFGAMSFTDKLSNGLAIVLIEKFDPCSSEICPAASDYYRHIESLVPGGANVAAILVLLTLIPQIIGSRRKRPKYVPMKNPKTFPKANAHIINEEGNTQSSVQ